MPIIIQPRSRLYGRKTTNEEITTEVARLYLGDPLKKQEPQNISQICKTLGYNSRDTVYRYLEKACTLGLLEKDRDTGRYKKPEKTTEQEFRDFSESHPILDDPLVMEWFDDMSFRKNNNPLATREIHIHNLQRFCNALRVNPVQLIQSKTTTGRLLQSYKQGLDNGTIPRIKKSVNSDSIFAFIPIKMAVRSFVSLHGISLPKGSGGIWSAKVVNHGRYADIRLSDGQFLQLENILLEDYGIDSDIYRLTWVGIESCARMEALLTMNLEWSEIKEDDGSVTFFMTAYEKKTKHIRNGKWIKFITRKETQESLRNLKARGTSSLLWEGVIREGSQRKEIAFRRMYSVFLYELKKIYKKLGLVNHYFYEHPVHALRHIGAHYWLKITNYDYAYVAKLGGWNIVNELIDSYGEMPPEMMTEKLRRYRMKTTLSAFPFSTNVPNHLVG